MEGQRRLVYYADYHLATDVTMEDVAKLIDSFSGIVTYIFVGALFFMGIFGWFNIAIDARSPLYDFWGYRPREERFLLGSWHLLNPRAMIMDLYEIFVMQNFYLMRLKVGVRKFLLVTRDKALINYVMKNIDYTHLCHDRYKALTKWVGETFLYGKTTHERWMKCMSILYSFFHIAVLRRHTDTIDLHAEFLTGMLRGQDLTDVEIFPFVSKCCLDIMFELATGASCEAQSGRLPEHRQYVERMTQLHQLTTKKMCSWWRKTWLYRCHPDYYAEKECIRVVHGAVWRHIEGQIGERDFRAREADTEARSYRKRYVLECMLNTRRANTELMIYDYRNLLQYFIYNGHYTTTTAICFAVLVLSWHPDIQATLFEEQKKLFGNIMCQRPTADQVDEMKLMEKFINETLRAYPPFPIFFRRTLRPRFYGDLVIPGGTTLWVHLFSFLRGLSTYDGFDKRRFHSACSRVSPPFVFGMGRQACPGSRLALNTMKIVLSRMVRTFEIYKRVEEDNLELLCETVLRSKCGAPVGLVPRPVRYQSQKGDTPLLGVKK